MFADSLVSRKPPPNDPWHTGNGSVLMPFLHVTGWPQSRDVAEDDLEFLILLSLSPSAEITSLHYRIQLRQLWWLEWQWPPQAPKFECLVPG